MKRAAIVLGLLLFFAPTPGAMAQQAADAGHAPQRISFRLQNVPFRAALDSLFNSTNQQYSIDPGVKDSLISLTLRDADFDTALRLLVKQAQATQPGVYAAKEADTWLIRVRETPPDAEKPVLEKIPIQFQNAEELVRQLDRVGATRDLDTIQALPQDNSLLIRGTPQQITQLKNVVRLLDNPSRMLSIRIGVTGPGVGGRPLQLASMTRTLNSREAVIDEQTTSGGEMARLRVQVRPLIQGDGGVLTESDWDLSLPIAGGPKGPIRLVKRLTTTARLRPGRSVTVGEVDLAPFGGNGTVRLWLRADLIQESTYVDLSTAAGESYSVVQVYSGKPYISAFWLANTLGGQLRRTPGGQYEIRPGLPKDPERLLAAEQPKEPGPFRLTEGTQEISDRLQFALTTSDQSRLVPDPGGDPLLPLEDLARLLGGRVSYDSAADSYRIEGGRRIGSLRFPATDARNR